jgi:hypothetical protein
MGDTRESRDPPVILMSLVFAAQGGQCQSAVTSLAGTRWGSAVQCFIAVKCRGEEREESGEEEMRADGRSAEER